jgi:hypothetical protein
MKMCIKRILMRKADDAFAVFKAEVEIHTFMIINGNCDPAGIVEMIRPIDWFVAAQSQFWYAVSSAKIDELSEDPPQKWIPVSPGQAVGLTRVPKISAPI